MNSDALVDGAECRGTNDFDESDIQKSLNEPEQAIHFRQEEQCCSSLLQWMDISADLETDGQASKNKKQVQGVRGYESWGVPLTRTEMKGSRLKVSQTGD